MSMRLPFLGAVVVLGLFCIRAPKVGADPYTSFFHVQLDDCQPGAPSCASPGDGIIQLGESVTTRVVTNLGSDGPNYDMAKTQSFGIIPSGTVPAGQIVGAGNSSCCGAREV